jgi:hypothetical protein
MLWKGHSFNLPSGNLMTGYATMRGEMA